MQVSLPLLTSVLRKLRGNGETLFHALPSLDSILQLLVAFVPVALIAQSTDEGVYERCLRGRRRVLVLGVGDLDVGGEGGSPLDEVDVGFRDWWRREGVLGREWLLRRERR